MDETLLSYRSVYVINQKTTDMSELMIIKQWIESTEEVSTAIGLSDIQSAVAGSNRGEVNQFVRRMTKGQYAKRVFDFWNSEHGQRIIEDSGLLITKDTFCKAIYGCGYRQTKRLHDVSHLSDAEQKKFAKWAIANDVKLKPDTCIKYYRATIDERVEYAEAHGTDCSNADAMNTMMSACPVRDVNEDVSAYGSAERRGAGSSNVSSGTDSDAPAEESAVPVLNIGIHGLDGMKAHIESGGIIRIWDADGNEVMRILDAFTQAQMNFTSGDVDEALDVGNAMNLFTGYTS